MRLAISNIAWDVAEDEQVSQLLIRYGIDAIDIAPGKYFPDLANTSDQHINHIRTWWAERGIELTGMQGLLFGTHGLNVFGSVEVRNVMLKHFAALYRIAAGLGITRLVFGSPKNRDRRGLSDYETLEIAVLFFRQLGDLAQSNGVTLCLEPNPSCYGANFMTTSAETASVVKYIDHPAIKMQLDTGALTINREKVQEVLASNAKLIGHIHASEPDLLPLGDGITDHKEVYTALQAYLPEHLVCIEMLATKEESHLLAIERALRIAKQSYQPAAGVN
ncbi:MAG: sugar phosphate isomerase/epimerase [Burkholderiaceae bacterium]|nr:sugar phosphate isomerase/epimerase [Burkholderiaceae bacterium]